MKRPMNRSSMIAIALIVGVCSFLGGIYGSQIGSAAAASQKDAVEDQVRELTQVFDVVQRNYAAEADWEQAIYLGAIPGMLRSLDPHSQFFDPESFRRLREEQRGSYAGVGMQIRHFRGKTMVDHPFPETPAFRAGVRPGDVIAEVDGESTEGLTVQEVALAVRGEQGTVVRLTLQRRGVERSIDVDLVRADIPRPSVPLSFFVERDIGYIKVTTFSETTGAEIDQALRALSKQGLSSLVLDLRSNNGGLLGAGVHVADRFLRRGQIIVSHRGRASRERVYKARRGHRGELYPMTVLVNCHSASAAEIVAGALQDHDRALIVGANTFGKGLVQSVFDLGNSTGLVLTTARYYTPTGRLIQRPYNNVSLMEYYADPCNSEYRPGNGDAHLTTNGRRVYGGGGIAPDVRLPELDVRTDLRRSLDEQRAFEGYAQEFSLEQPEIPAGWEPDEQILADFRRYLESEGIPFGESDFEEERDYLYRLVNKHIHIACKNLYEGWRADAELDPAIRQAVDLLPQARALLERSGQILAQRRPPPNP